jgi:Ca2+-transporting ATPase
MQRPRKHGTKIVNRPQIVRCAVSGFLVALTALLVLRFGPDKPSTTHASVSMTMAFPVVAFSGVNLGVVMRRERKPAWASPVFPYLGWIIAGWALTSAAVELNMLQRLLDTESLTGSQWAVVVALSLITPALVWADKAIQLDRQKTARVETPPQKMSPSTT